MGVKFGTEEGTKFHPHRCNDKGVGPQNWNFYSDLTEIWNINAQQGRIPCAILTKFAEFVPRFRMRWVLKFGWIFSRGYGVMEVLSWGGRVSPKFSAPPSGEIMRQTRKHFPGERTCSRSSITMPSLVGLGFHPPPGWPKMLSFLSVCLFLCPSRFWTSEFVRPISPWRRWSRETILMPLYRGRFVVVHPCSTFWDWWQLATSLNGEVQKTAKIGVFRRHRTTE